PHVDDARLARMSRLNRAMRVEHDEARWLALDAEFHRTLYEPAGRPSAIEFVQLLRGRIERYVLMRSESFQVEGTRRLTREHATIVRLVRAGDAGGARAVVERHLNRTRDAVVKLRRATAASSLA